MDVIWRRKKNWIGHIVRGESLLKEMIEGRMIGKRPWGRKRLGMLNEFLKEATYAELKRKAEHRKEWKTWKPRTCLTQNTNGAESKINCCWKIKGIIESMTRRG